MHRREYEESIRIDEIGYSFTALLMATISKAHPETREKLRAAFPDVAAEWEARNEARGGALNSNAPIRRVGEPNHPEKDYRPNGGVYDGGSAPRVGEMRARDY